MKGSDEIIAVIFDLDGVLVHTDRLHAAAWKVLADRLGLPFDEKDAHRLRGVSRMDSLDIVLEKSTRRYAAAERERLAEEKNRVYRGLLAELGPEAVDADVRHTLAALRAGDILLAVGSSSKNAADILRNTGLRGYFDAVVDGTAITRAKPDPEVFLRAAERLGVSPPQALVVEDAAAGILAARAGGFSAAAFGGDAAVSPWAEYRLDRLSQIMSILLPQSRGTIVKKIVQ